MNPEETPAADPPAATPTGRTPRKVLVIDVGGNHVKILATGQETVADSNPARR